MQIASSLCNVASPMYPTQLHPAYFPVLCFWNPILENCRGVLTGHKSRSLHKFPDLTRQVQSLFRNTPATPWLWLVAPSVFFSANAIQPHFKDELNSSYSTGSLQILREKPMSQESHSRSHSMTFSKHVVHFTWLSRNTYDESIIHHPTLWMGQWSHLWNSVPCPFLDGYSVMEAVFKSNATGGPPPPQDLLEMFPSLLSSPACICVSFA